MDNFEFDLVTEFAGYNSSRDKTNLSENFLIRGSKNVYKKISGTIASRPGLKRRGAVDATISGVTSEYTWKTSLGSTIPVRVTSLGKLQFEYNLVWYDLLTGQTSTRFVFDEWFDTTEKKDRLIFVQGDSSMRHWSGGIATLSSGNNRTISMIGNNAAMTSIAVSDTSSNILSVTNGVAGVLEQGALALLGQPSNGETIVLTINGTAVTITFVSVIGAAAGNVLIGANTLATRANLLGLLQAPGTTNATQVALSAGNQTLVGYMTYALSNSLIKTGTTTWAQAGFATNVSDEKIITINSTDYPYSAGENSTILTGVTGDPSAEAANSVVWQKVVVTANTPSASFNSDFIKVIGNQAYVGSYTSRLLYISLQTDFKNYAITSPRVPGGPALLILDDALTGIGVKAGQARVSGGDSSWYTVSFLKITVGTTLTEQVAVDKKEMAGLVSAYAHEFIQSVGDDLIYLSKSQQLLTYATARNLNQPAFPSLSQYIQTELSEENFTGGHLKSIGDILYLTSPTSGRDYMYETRQALDAGGNIVTERFWHPPQVRNISRFTVIDGVTFGYSNANPQIYQVWSTSQWFDDSPSEEELPYECVMRMAYRNNGRRQGLTTFDKFFTEGYISNGANLYRNVYFDYQGASGIQNQIINSVLSPTKFFTGNQPPSVGSASLGDAPLGDGLTPESNDQELLPKFLNITDVNPVNCFEYCLELYSTDPYCRWECLAIGVNAKKATSQATFIRK